MSKLLDAGPFYRRVIGDAFRIAISHTHLWIFGFFAAFIGFGGVFEIFLKTYSGITDRLTAGLPSIGLPMIPGLATVKAIIRYSPSPFISSVLFLVVSLLVLMVGAWVICVAVGALIGSVRKIERGGQPHFSDGMKMGADSFWKILILTVGVKTVIALAMLLSAANLGAMLGEQTYFSALLYVVSFALFSVIAVGTTIVSVFASCFMVIKGEDLVRSIRHGWELLNGNWLMSLEMLCVLLGIDLIIGGISLLLLAALAAPAVFLFVVSAVAKWRLMMMIFTALTAVAIAVSAMIIGSFYTTLRTAAWTLFWIELVEHKRASKLMRLIAAIRRLATK